jgi:uncharacterized protein YndB with AHSA1/START domain
MTTRSVTHATFTIDRTYPASPGRVFAAFASKEAKARWFGSPEHPPTTWELDFRVGGHERNIGASYAFDARYYEIIPSERIVFAYDMHMGDARISVSLTTIELRAEGTGTRMVFTEQGAFLDGLDDPKAREGGTREMLDALGASL